MADYVWTGPAGIIEDVSKLDIHQRVLSPSDPYWARGNGGASIEVVTPQNYQRILIVSPHANLGVYLKFVEMHGARAENTWLSLSDASSLDKVVECAEGWHASVGLFLKPDNAWNAVEDFLTNGERSKRIQWVGPDQIPDSGNW